MHFDQWNPLISKMESMKIFTHLLLYSDQHAFWTFLTITFLESVESTDKMQCRVRYLFDFDLKICSGQVWGKLTLFFLWDAWFVRKKSLIWLVLDVEFWFKVSMHLIKFQNFPWRINRFIPEFFKGEFFNLHYNTIVEFVGNKFDILNL